MITRPIIICLVFLIALTSCTRSPKEITFQETKDRTKEKNQAKIDDKLHVF